MLTNYIRSENHDFRIFFFRIFQVQVRVPESGGRSGKLEIMIFRSNIVF